MKRKNIRFLPLFFAAVLLFTMGEPPAFAQTVSENTVSGQTLPVIQTGAVTGPANPVHHCTQKGDGTDYTDFSYIYFGSYPQSEVTDSATKAVIDKAISTSGIQADAGIDVWAGGAKYRRIKKTDTNNDQEFDEVPNSGYRYFKWERIKWRVLKNDGKTLFVVADKAIDCKRYNEERKETTWETSTIRNWVNVGFYTAAFSSGEQNDIEAQTVINENNPEYDINGGNNTNDKIYLLSIGEVTNEEYGFCSNKIASSMSRKMKASDYANARGCSISIVDAYMNNCYWWLRSPGNSSSNAALVEEGGNVKRYGYGVYAGSGGVCPVLHIELDSSFWTPADVSANEDVGADKDVGGEKSKIQVKKLTLIGPSAKLAAGKIVPLTLQVFPENAANKAVSFQSSNSKYAVVDQTGKVSIKKAGAGKTVTITATALDGSQVKTSYKFKIMKHSIKKITLKAPAKTLKPGKSMTVKAGIKTTGKNVNKSLKWKSSNKKYAAVNSKGKVTAKKTGKGKTVTITAAATDGSGKKGKVKIRIK